MLRPGLTLTPRGETAEHSPVLSLQLGDEADVRPAAQNPDLPRCVVFPPFPLCHQKKKNICLTLSLLPGTKLLKLLELVFCYS